jgi:hypothetical protein
MKKGHVLCTIDLYKQQSNNTIIPQYAPFLIYFNSCLTSLCQCHLLPSHKSQISHRFQVTVKPKEETKGRYTQEVVMT